MPPKEQFLSQGQRYQPISLPQNFSDKEMVKDWTLLEGDRKRGQIYFDNTHHLMLSDAQCDIVHGYESAKLFRHLTNRQDHAIVTHKVPTQKSKGREVSVRDNRLTRTLLPQSGVQLLETADHTIGQQVNDQQKGNAQKQRRLGRKLDGDELPDQGKGDHARKWSPESSGPAEKRHNDNQEAEFGREHLIGLNIRIAWGNNGPHQGRNKSGRVVG